ncbi:hypothetical protein AGMMS49545_24070 [Betaproteobacteria bacterium]|nr:hypothetical protein AGMMS49545_24070 [Betaproteobacteria bacterium]
MQAKFKYVLGVVIGLLFSVAAMASEPVPIEDRDAFEKQLITCISSDLKSNCIASLFSAHFDPAFKDRDNTVSYVNNSVKNDMENCSVYKVHVVNRVLKADLFDNRSYVIECSNVTFFGLYIGLSRMLKNPAPIMYML